MVTLHDANGVEITDRVFTVDARLDRKDDALLVLAEFSSGLLGHGDPVLMYKLVDAGVPGYVELWLTIEHGEAARGLRRLSLDTQDGIDHSRRSLQVTMLATLIREAAARLRSLDAANGRVRSAEGA